MARIVINECFGGFSLSNEAVARLKELGHDNASAYSHDMRRDDSHLVQVVEELGSKRASGGYAELAIVEIPDDVKWHVHEYDGLEEVHEDHRTWRSDGVEENCA